MKSITVHTKSELENAKDEKYEEIIVEGTLADNLKTGKKVTYVGGVTLALLTAALAAAPFTGGLSFFAAAPIAMLTGMEIAVIIAVTAVGLALILAIFKDYEEIEYSEGRLILRKKQN